MKMKRVVALLRGPVAFWALAGLVLLVSHDAIFTVQVGLGERLTRVLREAGHGYWGFASLILAGIGLVVAIAIVHRIRTLRRRAADVGGSSPDARGTGRALRFLGTWTRLFAVVAIGFAFQENVEHLAAHGHAPGLGALVGPEYPLALPVIGLITAIAAAGFSALRATELGLLAAIESALRLLFGHAPHRLIRPPQRASLARISPIALSIAGRAPPLASVGTTWM